MIWTIYLDIRDIFYLLDFDIDAVCQWYSLVVNNMILLVYIHRKNISREYTYSVIDDKTMHECNFATATETYQQNMQWNSNLDPI